MKYITPIGGKGEMDITSVVLDYDFNISNKETSLCMWHCPVCRNPLIQFSGRMVAIVPGITPTKTPPLIVMCRNCNRRYKFVAITTS